ncbi:MAG: peptidylprolyl isomerase [Thermoguttaceae bacterium]
MSRKNTRFDDPRANQGPGRLRMVLGGVAVVTISLIIRYYWGADSASADPATPTKAPATSTTPPSMPSKMQVVAEVNRERITRDQLGQECLRHYGEPVLESLINKYLISEECRRQNIVITRGDVSEEIERMASQFSVPTEQWLTMLEEERGINGEQYAADIVWPMLALRRLAGTQIEITQEDLVKEFQTRYGPAIDARLIACESDVTAREVHAKAVAEPGSFPDLAKEYSIDAASASAGGLIQPIRMHGSYPEIERAAFNMKDGQVSEVIPAGGQYVILKRNRELPGPKAVSFDDATKDGLRRAIRKRKMRSASNEVFQQLQANTEVVNVLNDPIKSRQMPGVAALVNTANGTVKVTTAHLADACIQRYGKEVLEGTINRRLIEQACKRANIVIGEADLNEEIARAASISVDLRPDETPDIKAWLTLVTENQGVSVDVYRHDSVWPSVALKKLVAGRMKVSEEDLRRGYEANYGPRVRCLAIVLNDLRLAQRVWAMARDNCTAHHFGVLAAEYSVEGGSRGLSGKVPPIKKHGGQPKLEEEAFKLQPGQISGIIQADDQFVILFCEGRTTPVDVEYTTVRQYIFEDVYEKKERIEMAKQFRQLQDEAMIENKLTNTVRWPKEKTTSKPAVPTTSLRPVSAG